ncbi:MAG: hypothetical protein KKH28_09510 [Elusimicrobia bacterium]|nr:hypothetical protein [Elusimicrobiota bacterium]
MTGAADFHRSTGVMMGKKDILAAVSPEEALAVLNELTKDPRIRKRAEEVALAVVGDVDIDTVAEEVFYELDSIAVEDVWDNSGATRDGYVEPGEYAWQLFENALKLFEEHLRKCHKLSLVKQAKLQCMGILKGIWRFESESKSEFKDWATDAPAENSARVFDEWKKRSKNPKDIADIKSFMDSLRRKTA